MYVMSALANSIHFSAPKPIHSLLLANIENQDYRRNRTTALLERHKCGRTAAFGTATSKFGPKRRQNIGLAHDDYSFKFLSRVIDQ